MTNAARTALRYMVEQPAALGRRLGYDRLRDDLHGEWLRMMLNADKDMTLLAHRGSYKTTCLCIVLALLMAIEPDKNILFLRKTDADVVEVIRQVSRIISHEEFQRLTAWLYSRRVGREEVPSDPLRIVQGNATMITCDNYAAPRGAVQLLGIGLGGSLTGKHADIIVTDDIINRLDRVSRAERERTRAVYMELQNVLIPGGRFINTGTPWHREDAFNLMPAPVRYDCYTTGMLTDAQIDHLRGSMEPSLFAANYELRHIASGGALFGEAPVMFDDEALLHNGIAHIDAAYGGDDYTAFTMAKRVGGTIYMYGRMWHGHVDTVMESCIMECRRLRCSPLMVETNGDKGYLARELRGHGMEVMPYHESMGKYQKISTFLRKWWKNIRWLRGTDPEYLNQIQEYTEEAVHDDAPDSAACLCRKLDRNALSLE